MVLRSQADSLYIFRTTDKRDLGLLRDRIGAEPAGACINLPPYRAVLWRPGEPPRYVETSLDALAEHRS